MRGARVVAFLILLCVFAERSGAAVRVALLQTDPERTGEIVAVVESQLTAEDKVALVERQQIDKLLNEQQLSTALGADAVVGRVSFGKILQADLLVFIQPQPEQQKRLNVIISETRQGLRLLRGAVSTENSEHAAADLERLIGSAVAKHSQRIRAVFAVPPFVCNDLGYTYTYLSGAYARVVEGALEQQPGALVVELAEARAVAQEIIVAGGADVQRPLPLYVMGEYRTKGPKAARHVKISLKLLRGTEVLGSAVKENLALADAPKFLQQAAASSLARSAAGAPTVADSKVEAAQLAQRARLLVATL